MNLAGLRCAVVGGSIGGLSAALGLLRHGADVHVFERAPGVPEGRGAGLGVDPRLLEQVLGGAPAPATLQLNSRRVFVDGEEFLEPIFMEGSHYELVRNSLRAPLPDERYHPGAVLASVEQPEGGPVRVGFEDGRVETCELLVCADGYQSTARRWLLPEGAPLQPEYAGYVLWRGLMEEAALSPEVRSRFLDRMHIASRPPYHMVLYPVPGKAGERTPGGRRLNWGWYFRMPEAQARALSPHRCPPELVTQLLEQSRRLWPASCHAVVEETAAAGRLSAWPILEYSPPAMVRGRACLLGDAAHVASPITGSGARFAMLDALQLVDSLVRQAPGGAEAVALALRDYEARRLGPARELVAMGHARGASFR